MWLLFYFVWGEGGVGGSGGILRLPVFPGQLMVSAA